MKISSLILVLFCAYNLLADDLCVIKPIELPESYESERIKRIESLLDISSFDFSYSMPPNHKLVAEFKTFYKNILCEDASYELSVTPSEPDRLYEGRIRIVSKGRDHDVDWWRQWQINIDRGRFGGDMMVAGLPFDSYARLKDAPEFQQKADGHDIFFKEARLSPTSEKQKIWHYITCFNNKQSWRYELIVRIVPVK